MHRGYEKLTEVRTYPQVTTLINRIDWLGSFANEVPFILAAEQLMDVEAPPRAQWIRTILFELARIANIVLFLGDMGVQLGALTPVFYAFRDREHVLNQIEAVTGGRFHPNFDRIGGLKDDLPKGWIDETKARHGQGPHASATRSRTCSSATRSSRPAPAASASSPPTSASATACPAPTSGPAASTGTSAATRPSAWPGTRSTGRSGPTPTATRSPATGCASRRPARPRKIVDQLLDGLPAGPIMAKVPRIIKVPAGEAYVATENPLGEMGYYVVSKGDLGPFRVKIRSAVVQQHLDRARGCSAASTCPTSSRSSPASTSSSGTSTGEDRSPHRARRYWQQTILRTVVVARGRAARPRARSSTSSCSRW